MNLTVEDITSDSFQPIPNQFLVGIGGMLIFQSYRTVCCIKHGGKVYLRKNAFDLSKTTSKYLREFLYVAVPTKKFLKSIENDPEYVWGDNFDNLQITVTFAATDTGEVPS